MNDITPLNSDSETADLQCEFRTIPLTELTLPDDLFDKRTMEEATPIQILIPLTVFKNGTTYTIVDGFKRFLYATETGAVSCNCTVLTPAPSPAQMVLLRIRLNHGRPFHFFEKLNYIRYLKKTDDEAFYNKACEMISFPGREQHDFEQLADCSEAITGAVATGRIEKQTAFEINRSSESERNVLLSFFSSYRFSRQTQRELLDWIFELAFRERCTVPELLQASWLSEIENNTRLNPPQKIERIHSAFFNRRFPTLAQAKKRWKTLAAKHNPDPSRVQFKPSEAFEKNRVELKITITSAEEARRIFSGFNSITDTEWDQLIYPAQFSVNPDQPL